MNDCIISVCGEGTLRLSPDYIRLGLYVSYISPTIFESQQEVNKTVKKLMELLNKYEIPNIQTLSIDFYPYYDYEDSKKVYKGQKVVQDIICKIYELNKNLDKAKEILDNIGKEFENISLRVSFGLDKFNENEIQTRELAYIDAIKKAEHYAKLSNLKIIKAMKISEFSPEDKRNQMWYSSVGKMEDKVVKEDFFTELPIGNIEIGMKLYCDFLAK